MLQSINPSMAALHNTACNLQHTLLVRFHGELTSTLKSPCAVLLP